MEGEWEARLEAWRAELDLLARATGTTWVPLAEAERQAGVSRSALRSWYRGGEISSRLVDGPHGPQRLVPLEAVLDRAERSARIRRRAEREISLEAQVAMLRGQVDRLEIRLAALEARGRAG
ncbi:excisionase [Pseudonocardia humida]|uniref:Excisionase n=1 Tax=Pseudonocardia humida TaxID=2800819 RepID=A0ABT0ZYT3_9PSEU|nr:excisionase [Pseudonocardia humida]MCO1655905.1 excisionase [Pseudonocardia humida]